MLCRKTEKKALFFDSHSLHRGGSYPCWRRLGFTILEILIALGILAGSVGIFLGQVEMSARLNAKDAAMIRAVSLGNNKMVEVLSQLQADMKKGVDIDEDSQTGKFDEPFEDYAWDLSIRKIEIPTLDSQTEGQSARVAGAMQKISRDISKAMREVKLTVSWGEKENKEGETEPYTFVLTTHVAVMK